MEDRWVAAVEVYSPIGAAWKTKSPNQQIPVQLSSENPGAKGLDAGQVNLAALIS